MPDMDSYRWFFCLSRLLKNFTKCSVFIFFLEMLRLQMDNSIKRAILKYLIEDSQNLTIYVIGDIDEISFLKEVDNSSIVKQ